MKNLFLTRLVSTFMIQGNPVCCFACRNGCCQTKASVVGGPGRQTDPAWREEKRAAVADAGRLYSRVWHLATR